MRPDLAPANDGGSTPTIVKDFLFSVIARPRILESAANRRRQNG